MNIDDPILREVKALRDQSGRSLGRVISDLLAKALDDREKNSKEETFSWISRSMGARVDVSDKDALYRLLDLDSPK